MPIVYITKGLGGREETADSKVYLTKNLGGRQETQAAAAGGADVRNHIIPAYMRIAT